MALFTDEHCKDVQKTNNFNIPSDVAVFKFHLTMFLMGLQKYCINRLTEEGEEKFPTEQRKKLAEKIKLNVKQMYTKLLGKSPDAFKSLGRAVLDYESTLNFRSDKFKLEPYKFLAEAILEFYRTILVEEKGSLEELDKNYSKNSQYVEIIIKVNSKEEINGYFEMRKNVDSLSRIYKGIKLILESIQPIINKPMEITEIKIAEERLAVEESLRIAGEYLKSTKSTANLSPDVVKDLGEKGINAKILGGVRDTVMHGDFLPVIENMGTLEKIAEYGLDTIKNIIAKEISELEITFLRSISDRNLKRIESLKTENLKEDIFQENKKQLLDEINENKELMFSKQFSKNEKIKISESDSENNKKLLDLLFKELGTNTDKVKRQAHLGNKIMSEVIKKVEGAEDLKLSVRFLKSIKDGKATEKTVKNDLKRLLPKEKEKLVPDIVENFKTFYLEEIKLGFHLLKEFKNEFAIKSQISNIYDILEKYDTFRDILVGSNIGKVKAIRNYLAHGNSLTAIDKDNELRGEIVKIIKEGMIETLPKFIEGDTITLRRVEGMLDHITNRMKKTPMSAESVALGEVFQDVAMSLCSHVPRKRRSANEDCLTWEEIDMFNFGGPENRDPDNIIIDSEKFISSVSNELETSEEKFSNFIALASESEVVGDYSSDVNILINTRKHNHHLEKIGKVSGMAMHGMIAKNLVGELLNGDYKDVVMNLGFLVGSEGFAKFAEATYVKGAGYILKGRALLGKSLRFGSAFLSRGASALIAYDLYNEVKEYEKCKKLAEGHAGRTCNNHLVPIIGDSVQLTVDSATLGIEIGAELGSELLAEASVSAGPIGAAVGVLIFVGIDVYSAVRTVEKLNEKIHLSGWEKFHEGILAFFQQQPSEHIQELSKEKDANNEVVKYSVNFLKNNTEILRYVCPSMKVIKYENKKKCLFPLSCIFTGDGKDWIENVGDKYVVKVILDNKVILHEKRSDIKLSRARPDRQEGIDLFCLPKGLDEPVPDSGSYFCDGAIGIEYENDRTGNYTLINLGNGNDTAKGFPDSSNIFVLGEGYKEMIGGKEDDIFILHGKRVNTDFGSNIDGFIDGFEGINTVDVSKLTPQLNGNDKTVKHQIIANFHEGTLKDTSKVTLNMRNINKYLGKKDAVDEVVSACDTKYIDGKGGESKVSTDRIIIPRDNTCSYNIKVVVNPYTNVINNASESNFTYIVKGEKGKETNIYSGSKLQNNNMFIFDYTLTDIAAVKTSLKNITFSFIEEFYKKENKIDEISSFNLTACGNYLNKTMYYLRDDTQIEIGQNNVYALQKTDKSIHGLIRDYSSLANRLKMYIFVHSNDEVLTIGHDNHDILMNDPNAKASHLVGNGGENVYTVTSGYEKLSLANLPISDVIIYDYNQESDIDNLDLRKIKEQVETNLKTDINTRVSKIGSDLLISLSLDDASKKEVVKIRINSGLENNWYKRVNVIMDSVFIIENILSYYKLTPKPFIFDDNNTTIYVINPRDVVKGNKIIVKKDIGEYIFARDKDSLFITNSLSSEVNKYESCTVILNDFFYKNNQDKMQTLNIVFNDRKILLTKEMIKLYSAEDFSELQRKVINYRYTSIIHSIKERNLFEVTEKDNTADMKKLIDQGISANIRNSKGQTLMHFAASVSTARYLIDEKYADFNVTDNFGSTPLHLAASNDRLEVVKYLIDDKNSDFNVKDKFGRTPMHLAAFGGGLKVLKYLTKDKGANLNLVDSSGRTTLHLAAINNQLKAVEYLVGEKDADLNVKDKSSCTPLHFSAYCGSLEIVQYLIGKGAELNITDNLGWMPLHAAADSSHLEIVKYFIKEKKALVNVKNGSGMVPLHLAASGGIARYSAELKCTNSENKDNIGWVPPYFPVSNGNIGMVRYLIEEENADFDVRDDLGWTPLHFAAYSGSFDIVKYLLNERNASLNITTYDNYNNKPLHFAAYSGSVEIVKYFIEEKHDDLEVKNSLAWVPLHFAVFNGKMGIVKYLTEEMHANADVKDSFGQTLLHLAAYRGKLDVVKYFIEENEINLNITDGLGWTPLHLAASAGKVEVVKYLIEERNADVNVKSKSGETPLYFAVMSSNLDIVKYLIEKGAKIDSKVDGKTPFDILKSKGYEDVVNSITEKLIKEMFDAVKYNNDFTEASGILNQGFSIDVKNNDGQTLLHFAASYGKPEIVKYLVEENGFDISIETVSSHTALHVAAIYNRLEVVKYLIEDKGVDFEVTDNSGNTPLHLAASYGSIDVVKYLVKEKGAKSHVLNSFGLTPFDLAKIHSHCDILQYLRRALDNRSEIHKHRKRRQINKNHSQHCLFCTSSATGPDNQPEIAASAATRSSSWINMFAYTIVDVVNCVSQFISSPFKHGDSYSNKGSKVVTDIEDVSAQLDIHGGILLVDVLLAKKSKRQIYSPAGDKQIPSLEAQAYALKIINEFKQILKEAAFSSGMSVQQLKIDFQEIQLSIFKKIMAGDIQGVSSVLYSTVNKSCAALKQKKNFLILCTGKIEIVLQKQIIPLVDKTNFDCLSGNTYTTVSLPFTKSNFNRAVTANNFTRLMKEIPCKNM